MVPGIVDRLSCPNWSSLYSHLKHFVSKFLHLTFHSVMDQKGQIKIIRRVLESLNKTFGRPAMNTSRSSTLVDNQFYHEGRGSWSPCGLSPYSIFT